MWRILAALVVLFHSTSGRAEWLRAESPNFVVYAETTSSRLRDRVLLLEDFDRLLRALTGTTEPPASTKLIVYLVDGLREMRLVAPVGQGVGGFYKAGPDAIIAVADNDGWTNWTMGDDDTLLHEYAHHFMWQYHPAPYPRWFAEGFADYVMTANIRPDRIEYGNYNNVRASWLIGQSGWIPYENILFGESRGLDAGRFYAQSWLLVHYIMADAGRRAAFTNYIQALARGEPARRAFPAAFRMQPTELDRTLRDYSRRITFHRLIRTPGETAPPVEVRRIGGAAIDLPLIEAALNWGVTVHEERTILERARRAGRGEDAFGQRVQAHAELLFGDPQVADRLLDPLLAASPNDVTLLYLKGLRHLVAGRRDTAQRAEQFRLARSFLGRAYRVNPDHYPTLYRYAEALSVTDQLLTENTQNILLLSSQLAPQVNEIRLAAAHLLLLRGEFDQARALLLPLSAESAHDDGTATRARTLLEFANNRRRPTDTDVFASRPKEAAQQ